MVLDSAMRECPRVILLVGVASHRHELDSLNCVVDLKCIIPISISISISITASFFLLVTSFIIVIVLVIQELV
jgi:hypothetical protein